MNKRPLCCPAAAARSPTPCGCRITYRGDAAVRSAVSGPIQWHDARKNALAGTKEYHVAFGEDSYTVVTAATTSMFRYELIDALAESQEYIILLMKKRYAQPLDKRTLTGGTVEEFKRFLEEKTGKTFRRVK